MKDTISRRAALNIIMQVHAESDENGARAAFDIFNRISDLPPAQQWIPCSVLLPEEDGLYLITGKRGAVYSIVYKDGRWYGGINPIAWMHLPEPYKEKEQ